MSKLYIRIADTPSKQEKGLMFVKNMPQDEGMLFSFSRNQKLRFWGENTYIPLDIAFVDSNGIIRKISNISPLSHKVVDCDVPCKYAVEANYGFFEDNKISVGDKMEINKDNEISFLTFAVKERNLKRTVSSEMSRRILSQLMSDEVAYDIDQTPAEEEEKFLPEISAEELSQYLEDNLEEVPQDVKPEGDLEGLEPPAEAPEVEPDFEYPKFTNAFDAQEWADDNNEVMRIAYTTKHGTGIVRDVEPHGTFHADTTGHEILVTYDRTVGDIRAFILQNVATFSFTGDRFEPKFKVS